METNWMREFFGRDGSIDYSILILIATIPVVIAFLLLVLQQIFYGSRARTRNASLDNLEALLSGDDEVDIGSIDLDALSRLDDLKNLQTRYQNQVSRNSSAFNLLIFSQYVVGAVLATSILNGEGEAGQSSWQYAEEILGLVVLISTAIHQRFRPDLLANQAKARLSRCRKLLLDTEDGILLVQGRVQKGSYILEVRSNASIGIAELEEMERAGLEFYTYQRLDPQRGHASQLAIAQESTAPTLGHSANGARSPEDAPTPARV